MDLLDDTVGAKVSEFRTVDRVCQACQTTEFDPRPYLIYPKIEVGHSFCKLDLAI